jgi:hypothetical protein
MAKPSQQQIVSRDPELTYTSAMRLYGGLAWGSLFTVGVGIVMILLPQVPRPWLWNLLPLWIGLVGIGVLLQWFVARGACPKCGHPQTVPPFLARCPQCRSYLKAVNRQIIRVI